jgi:glycosyltransferase involved in cell wall biosynthesis
VRDASSVLGITQAMIEWASGTANRRVREADRAFFHAYKRRTIDEPRLEEARDYWASCGIHGNEKQFIASFIGSLSNRLELRTLIKAAQAIGPQYRDKIRIVICGSGNDQKNLEAEAAGLPHVQFAGWIDRFKIEALLERSSIGLLPYPSSRDFIRSIPNKVGEYLSRGVPILSSVQGVSEELIGKGHCGKTYPNNDHDALAQLLIQLSEDGERVSAMSKNAATVFDKYLDADKVYGEFCDYLEGLALSRR